MEPLVSYTAQFAYFLESTEADKVIVRNSHIRTVTLMHVSRGYVVSLVFVPIVSRAFTLAGRHNDHVESS
eukprot:5761097-Pyramimonas_sp.AAC.1